MSTASAVADVVHASPVDRRGRVTQMRLVRSEWTKLRSLRSTRWSLGAAVLAMAGLGPLVGAIQMNRWDHMSLLDRLRIRLASTAPNGLPRGLRYTFSVGVDQLRRDESLAQLMARADGALYVAKASGRNRVMAA